MSSKRLSAILLERLHTANVMGTSLRELSKCYRLSYADVAREVKAWRKAHGFEKPKTMKKMDKAAEAVAGKGQHFSHAFRMDTTKY